MTVQKFKTSSRAKGAPEKLFDVTNTTCQLPCNLNRKLGTEVIAKSSSTFMYYTVVTFGYIGYF